MGLTNDEIETLIKAEEAKLNKEVEAKNLVAISELYHPSATVIHRGVRCYYGREEIQKAYEPFCQMEAKFETNPNYAAEADNGEYLIRRGTYIVVGNPKVFEYEQIYKKVNGTYLIYHDEFSFE